MSIFNGCGKIADKIRVHNIYVYQERDRCIDTYSSKALSEPRLKILQKTVTERSCPASTTAGQGAQELPPHAPLQLSSPCTPARVEQTQ